jgi:hypothetical protein
MRTRAEPLLAAYVWRAGDLTAITVDLTAIAVTLAFFPLGISFPATSSA